MRLKLVMIVSLVAALVGSGASITIILTRFASLKMLSNPDLLVATTFVLPILTVFLAALFVYRHTARRRKTQALLTGILAAFLSLTFYFLGSMLTSTSSPVERQPTVPRNTG